MNVTLQLKLGQPEGSDAEEVGDIVAVGLRTDFKADLSASANVKFRYLHATGVPDVDGPTFERVKTLLTEWDYAPMVDPNDPDEERVTVNKRVWATFADAMRPRDRTTFLADGEVTLSWNQAKRVVRRKLGKIDVGAIYDSGSSDEITDDDIINA